MKCQCGCGQETKLGNKYINNHHGKGKIVSEATRKKMSLANKDKNFSENFKRLNRKTSGVCLCGCGQLTKKGNEFINGHNSRTDNPMWKKEVLEKYFLGDKNPAKKLENRIKISKGLETRPISEQHRIHQSIAMKRWHSTEEGKDRMKEVGKKVSEKLTGRTKENDKGRQIQSIKMKSWWKDPKNKDAIDKLIKIRTHKITDWDFFNKHGTFKSIYPYPECFTPELRNKIRKLYDNKCVITGMTNEEHKQKYGFSLCIHHWTYDKTTTNPFYLIPVSLKIHSKTHCKKGRDMWIELFNDIAEEKYCELLKEVK